MSKERPQASSFERACRLILPYLHQAPPVPLSRPVGQRRLQFRQQDLFQAMRVCKLFLAIIEPILYTNICTDRFPSIFENVQRGNMRRRLAYTESVLIEYSRKNIEPFYYEIFHPLLGQRAWEKCGPVGKEGNEAVFKLNCEVEMAQIMLYLAKVIKIGPRAVLPNLRRIAVSSIYGELDITGRYYREVCMKGQRSELFEKCNQVWTTSYRDLDLTDYCMRNNEGPFSLPRVSYASKDQGPQPNCQTTVHFEEKFNFIPMVFGRSIRWVSDIMSEEDWTFALENIGRYLAILCHSPAHHPDRRDPTDQADINIYLSTGYGHPDSERDTFLVLPEQFLGRDITLREQREITSFIQRRIGIMLREEKWGRDLIRYYASTEAFPCAACGSGVPGKNAGEWATGPFRIDQGMDEDDVVELEQTDRLADLGAGMKLFSQFE